MIDEIDPEETAQAQAAMRVLKAHTHALMSRFDTVQIFVTKHDDKDGSTQSFVFGEGNFYARLGQIEEWISAQ